ncbi:DUF5908 family protein [Tenacibaculum sp. E3R01]|uniref:DUF5908 family protein n=1 Tax=Tenacibaculum sp. E3R01 TaxID=2267227 RepID=UPI001314B617|nr:DUF5908 family protein [Tenacibaculum sp. E3R01]
MPVEIRELIIKTEIKTKSDENISLKENEFLVFKEEILETCKRMLTEGVKKINYRR